jgi:8-oxo-dGTP pyrophosphatase MutT (NUDIX family)
MNSVDKNSGDAGQRLGWTLKSREKLGDYRIFSVNGIESASPLGKTGKYTVIDTHDWALIVPVLDTREGKQFVMVRQWRHGLQDLCVEFPGGVIEDGEEKEEGAARELREETGYRAGKIIRLATVNPNPAIMSNRVHFFLALDLVDTGRQELDMDEFVEVENIGTALAVERMGTPPFLHALSATALFFYERYERNERNALRSTLP